MSEKIKFIREIKEIIISKYNKIREAIRKAMEAKSTEKNEPNWKDMSTNLKSNLRAAEIRKELFPNMSKADHIRHDLSARKGGQPK